MLKRVALFLITNLAILVVLGVVLRVLGIGSTITPAGLNYGNLLAFAAVYGFVGSFISLALSKFMAKMFTRAQVIHQPRTEAEAWLVSTVRELSVQAGIQMPEVAIYDSPDVNAFATGMRKNAALVAVSTGLLERMDREEVKGVLGHEIAHVANGDMVTLALIQGVVNTFVIFFARVIGFAVDRWLSGSSEERRSGYGPGYWITTMVAEIFLGIIATMIVMRFSRWREFRADAGGAKLAGRTRMIAALERLKSTHEEPELPQAIRAFGIRGGKSGFLSLFSSHPPLEERIEALKATPAIG